MPTALQSDTSMEKTKKAMGVACTHGLVMINLHQTSDKQAHCDLGSERNPTLSRGRNTLTVNFTTRAISDLLVRWKHCTRIRRIVKLDGTGYNRDTAQG